MKIALSDDILRATEIEDLGESNSDLFRCQLGAAWPSSSLKAVEIDLSQTRSLDSFGLGALLAIYKWAGNHNGNGGVPVRLLTPSPPVQHILELTRLHRTLEIVKR